MNALIQSEIDTGHPAVQTERLTKRFGRTEALTGLNLVVPHNSVYLLVGPNGSGKTTTMKVLLDLVRPDEGGAEVFGLDCQSQGAEVRANIGYVPEGPTPGYGWMPVWRLLKHHATYYPGWDPDYAQALVEEIGVDLRPRCDRLSKGQARRVQIVMALAHRPSLLLLDEPMDGLDPVVRDRVIGLLASHLSETPTTVLATTHHVQELDTLADHLGVLHDGRLLTQNPREQLDRTLKRYRLEIPAEWPGVPELEPSVLRRNGGDNDMIWIIWGEQAEVTARIEASGAVVRDVAALHLEEAAVAFLSEGEGS
jgi:ABC-2 type transport system ATP-binding protein